MPIQATTINKWFAVTIAYERRSLGPNTSDYLSEMGTSSSNPVHPNRYLLVKSLRLAAT
ncbi:hypothetical protein M378DRAFT_159888 [Amanita muscaria Koide BX008]|uniref:Uncharacterized protein n=1 Tax=Amanita muscaria (strain Koide BX008) TaxID=946122 RepID=A0A0C2XC69_AMAMK|nr:hypothetical protein M378DRAFT_159888 [Amanita muscaria Koide BX008]